MVSSKAVALFGALLADAKLEVPVAPDGSYKVLVNGKEWFHSAPTSFRHQGRWFSSRDGSLQFMGASRTRGWGSAMAKPTAGHVFTWKAEELHFETSIRVFDDYAIFTQSFPSGATNTSTGDHEKLVSAFPTLMASWADDKGVVSYQGDMTGDGVKVGAWSSGKGSDVIGQGVKGSGPVAVFSQDLKETLVLSAFSNFMAQSQTFDGGVLSYGIMGKVASVPKGYSISTVISLSSGINSAMDHWGAILLKEYGKERYAYKRDLAVQTLGYSTDNGAYYYYHTEAGKNYEDTLLDVKAYADSAGIPYKYVLLDSWWYYKGKQGGVSQWEARPDVFPNGLNNLYEKTGWPQQLHNRYWSPDNVYMKQNGGAYNFHCDADSDSLSSTASKVCVPDDQQFWDDLIANHTATGMFMYEQDWLDDEFDWSETILGSATLGRTWMKQMDAGIVKANATLQLCMSHVRHVLQSVEMPSVTNSRASGDYHPGNGQWNVGTTGILAHALGFAPSKDNYWSTAVQSDSKYGPGTKEPHSRLQAAAITMSAGPVAPSDKIGASDVSLIMRACDASGRLLSPDRPATEIDSHFVKKAFSAAAGPDGHLWTTSSTVQSQRYTYVMAIELKSDYNLTLAELGLAGKHVATRSDGLQAVLDDATPLRLLKCGLDDFQFFTLSPVPKEGRTLLGEAAKWISVSAQRFAEIRADEVRVTGKPGENVSVSWLEPDAEGSWLCRSGQGGAASAQEFQDSEDNSKDACARLCSSSARCLAFDYTEKSKHDSCRLFDTASARLGNPGADDRKYCWHGASPITATCAIPSTGEIWAGIKDGKAGCWEDREILI